MSSWLSISLPNPFKSDDQSPSPPSENSTSSLHDDSPSNPSGGVKEDLSVLGQTIGRQLRGVAAFLAPAPPPQPPPSSLPDTASGAESSSQKLLGIKSDLVEIGGSFKSSLSLFATNKALSEISRLASNLLQFDSESNQVEGDEEEEDDGEAFEVAGVTEEVLDFVQEISLRPECWTDFPLSLDIDFDMSDAQKEHASTVIHLVPSLAVLRHKTCSNLSEDNFWMIYFIFLLPRLHDHDAKLLSTPEIVEAREILLQKLKDNRNSPVKSSDDSQTINLSQEGGKVKNTQGEGSPSQGKEALPVTVNAEQGVKIGHENTEQWLEEEDVDESTSSLDAQKQLENEEDVSFSDLEDDDNALSGRLSRFKPAQHERACSPSGSNEWVRLNESSGTQKGGQKAGSTSREKDSEGEDSNGWLTVDDVDSDSLAAV